MTIATQKSGAVARARSGATRLGRDTPIVQVFVLLLIFLYARRHPGRFRHVLQR